MVQGSKTSLKGKGGVHLLSMINEFSPRLNIYQKTLNEIEFNFVEDLILHYLSLDQGIGRVLLEDTGDLPLQPCRYPILQMDHFGADVPKLPGNSHIGSLRGRLGYFAIHEVFSGNALYLW